MLAKIVQTLLIIIYVAETCKSKSHYKLPTHKYCFNFSKWCYKLFMFYVFTVYEKNVNVIESKKKKRFRYLCLGTDNTNGQKLPKLKLNYFFQIVIQPCIP